MKKLKWMTLIPVATIAPIALIACGTNDVKKDPTPPTNPTNPGNPQTPPETNPGSGSNNGTVNVNTTQEIINKLAEAKDFSQAINVNLNPNQPVNNEEYQKLVVFLNKNNYPQGDKNFLLNFMAERLKENSNTKFNFASWRNFYGFIIDNLKILVNDDKSKIVHLEYGSIGANKKYFWRWYMPNGKSYEEIKSPQDIQNNEKTQKFAKLWEGQLTILQNKSKQSNN
ncbi:hypothetical protein ACW95P_01730 [Candidatus Mycoplasma pogonae]